MTNTQKATIKELCSIFKQLPTKDREHLLWVARGVLFASAEHDRAKSE